VRSDIDLIGCSLDRPWFSQSSNTRRPRHALSPSSTLRPPNFNFLDRFSSFFHPSQPTTGQSMELQRPQKPIISSHPGPRVVEVATVRDKEVRLFLSITETPITSAQALFVARRPDQMSDKVKRIKNPTWWTRCILFFCCVSVHSVDTNGRQ